MTGQRASGIVGQADIEDAAVGTRRQHGFYVVRVTLRQGHFDYAGAGGFRGKHSRFKSGVGGHVAALWRGERADAVMQQLGRSRLNGDVVGLHAFDLRDGVDEIFGQAVEVTSALGRDGGDGLTG